jgi:cell division inhibitor SepF
MTVWKKAMSYLGLGPDDAYDDYDIQPEPERVSRSAGRPAGGYVPDPEHGVRPVPRQPRPEADYAGGRPAGEEPAASRSSRTGSAVRPVASNAPKAPHTVRPLRFDQAQEVADTFKHGQAVILNLQDVERDTMRRLIDFASGLCYGLNGKLDKVASGVYLLTPANVSEEDRRQMAGRDYD